MAPSKAAKPNGIRSLKRKWPFLIDILAPFQYPVCMWSQEDNTLYMEIEDKFDRVNIYPHRNSTLRRLWAMLNDLADCVPSGVEDAIHEGPELDERET